MTLGYLLPEFPSQTHSFFWREARALERLGVTLDLVSTRRPPARLISHGWAEQAMTRTTYLHPARCAAAIGATVECLRAGPIAWSRLARAVLDSEGSMIRSILLALMGCRLAHRARTRSWSHVHVHSCADAANVARFAQALTGLSYSLTLHGPLQDYGGNQRLKWRGASFGVVITRRLRDEVRAALNGAAPAILDVAPMGVELSQFVRSAPYRCRTGDEVPRVFSCGRLSLCKAHDDLVRAIAVLRDRGLRVELRIAGDDDGDGTYRADLERLILQLAVADRVTLLGAVSEQVVRRELEAAHVFALASLNEPLGVALMEAMAMEVPVVATGAGGVPELVTDGMDGLLVPPRRPEQLADAITRVVTQPALALALSRAGREKIARQFHSGVSATVIAGRVAELARGGVERTQSFAEASA